jgi:hypothetical protein
MARHEAPCQVRLSKLDLPDVLAASSAAARLVDMSQPALKMPTILCPQSGVALLGCARSWKAIE